MKPIEELAREVHSLECRDGKVYISVEIPLMNGQYGGQLINITDQLLEFRTAIIKDFVESLKPAGEVVIEKDLRLVSDKEMGGATDTYSYIEVASTRVRLNKSLNEGFKLYDLSEWKGE